MPASLESDGVVARWADGQEREVPEYTVEMYRSKGPLKRVARHDAVKKGKKGGAIVEPYWSAKDAAGSLYTVRDRPDRDPLISLYKDGPQILQVKLSKVELIDKKSKKTKKECATELAVHCGKQLQEGKLEIQHRYNYRDKNFAKFGLVKLKRGQTSTDDTAVATADLDAGGEGGKQTKAALDAGGEAKKDEKTKQEKRKMKATAEPEVSAPKKRITGKAQDAAAVEAVEKTSAAAAAKDGKELKKAEKAKQKEELRASQIWRSENSSVAEVASIAEEVAKMAPNTPPAAVARTARKKPKSPTTPLAAAASSAVASSAAVAAAAVARVAPVASLAAVAATQVALLEFRSEFPFRSRFDSDSD